MLVHALLQVLVLMLTLSLSLLLKMILDLHTYERLDTCTESGTESGEMALSLGSTDLL